MQSTINDNTQPATRPPVSFLGDPTEILQPRPQGTSGSARGFSLPATANLPLPGSEFDSYQEREQRRNNTSAGNYIGSIWRQDSYPWWPRRATRWSPGSPCCNPA